MAARSRWWPGNPAGGACAWWTAISRVGSAPSRSPRTPRPKPARPPKPRQDGRLRQWAPASVTWFVDRPVSNSGRLAGWIRERAPEGIAWDVELPHDADAAVIETAAVACSADARVLDLSAGWVDLVGETLTRAAVDAWVVDLRPR